MFAPKKVTLNDVSMVRCHGYNQSWYNVLQMNKKHKNRWSRLRFNHVSVTLVCVNKLNIIIICFVEWKLKFIFSEWNIFMIYYYLFWIRFLLNFTSIDTCIVLWIISCFSNKSCCVSVDQIKYFVRRCLNLKVEVLYVETNRSLTKPVHVSILISLMMRHKMQQFNVCDNCWNSRRRCGSRRSFVID